MIHVRKYSERDLEQILKIERSSFKFPYPMRLFKELLSNRYTRMFVAETVSDKIVGYILYSIKSPKCLFISVAVDSEYRRRGIGTMLMKAFLDDIKDVVEIVELQVGCNNVEAIKFYHKFGFKVTGMLKGYYPDEEDAFLMVNSLN